MPEFHILDFGDTARLATAFTHAGSAATETAPVMEDIAVDMLRVEGIVFSSGGRRGGGSWAQLKPDTIRKKGSTQILRTENAKQGYSELGSDTLFRSVTELGAAFQVLRITNSSIEFGTDRPYAGVQQYGGGKGGRVAARPFIRFLDTDVQRWEYWLLRHLMRAFV